MSEATSFEDLLLQAKRGEAPSPFGRLEFSVEGSPSSVQAAKAVRDAYVASIRQHFSNLKFLLTGEIMLELTWYISAQDRYETDAKADIDNCIKPIVDALAGPQGIMIDDCQIRGLYVCWRHSETGTEHLDFQLEFGPDDFTARDELAFVRLGNALCTPVNRDWPAEARAVWAEMLKKMEASKAGLARLGTSYLPLAGLLGTPRPFHATRLRHFPIISLDEFVRGGPPAT
jgi:Holliday junction resolvase RusA-like endonuclease